jgi:rare lipoprotein A
MGAHRDLPKGTHLEVTNLDNNESTCITVRDRGPYRDKKHRIVDLSVDAAQEIGLTRKKGLVRVIIRTVESCPKPG